MSIKQLLLLFFVVCLNMHCQSPTDKNNKEIGESVQVIHKIKWHGLDDFSAIQQEKLKSWLREITKMTEQTIGRYQFDVHYYFHIAEGNEPVPYAHTSRKYNEQAVHFYVNPSYGLISF